MGNNTSIVQLFHYGNAGRDRDRENKHWNHTSERGSLKKEETTEAVVNHEGPEKEGEREGRGGGGGYNLQNSKTHTHPHTHTQGMNTERQRQRVERVKDKKRV